MEPTTNKSSATIWIVIIVLIIIIVGIILAVRMNKNTTPVTTPTAESTSTPEVAGEATSTAKVVTVSLTDSGYSPASVTINIGDTVKFVNNSTARMWVASDPHPTHTDYPGFDEKTSANAGESYSFTFTKAGHWGYHNHLNPSEHATVIVQSTDEVKG